MQVRLQGILLTLAVFYQRSTPNTRWWLLRKRIITVISSELESFHKCQSDPSEITVLGSTVPCKTSYWKHQFRKFFFPFKSLDEMDSAKTYTEVKHDHLCSLYRSYILVWLFSVSCTEKVNSVSHKSFLHLIVITDKKYLTWMSSCTDAKTHYVQRIWIASRFDLRWNLST